MSIVKCDNIIQILELQYQNVGLNMSFYPGIQTAKGERSHRRGWLRRRNVQEDAHRQLESAKTGRVQIQRKGKRNFPANSLVYCCVITFEDSLFG